VAVVAVVAVVDTEAGAVVVVSMDADVVVVVVVEGGAMVGVVAVVVGASMASVGVLSPLPQAAPIRARAEMRSALRFMGDPLPTCIRYTQRGGNRFTEEMAGGSLEWAH